MYYPYSWVRAYYLKVYRHAIGETPRKKAVTANKTSSYLQFRAFSEPTPNRWSGSSRETVQRKGDLATHGVDWGAVVS